jgi:hypothetical protein
MTIEAAQSTEFGFLSGGRKRVAKQNERLSEHESGAGIFTTVPDREVGSYKKRYFDLLDEIHRLIDDVPMKVRDRLAELDRNGRIGVRRKTTP